MFVNSTGGKVDVNFEKEEQVLVRKYLPKDATVLELGARYGTVSCVISEILNDPTRHVAVEPDVSVIESLEKNRDANGGKFYIYNGVVSKFGYNINFIDPKMEYAEYGTYTKKTDNPTINNISLKQIQEKYNMTFDYLIADCEGFLYDFIEENEWFLEQINGIIYEQDGIPWKEMIPKYEEIDKILEKYGFKLVHTVPHQTYNNNPRFHNVWVK